MQAPESISQSNNDFKTEIISILPEHLKEIVKILFDQQISYKYIGEDQSKRQLLQITYHKAQTNTVQFIKKGLCDLERSTFISDLIITSIRNLLA